MKTLLSFFALVLLECFLINGLPLSDLSRPPFQPFPPSPLDALNYNNERIFLLNALKNAPLEKRQSIGDIASVISTLSGSSTLMETIQSVVKSVEKALSPSLDGGSSESFLLGLLNSFLRLSPFESNDDVSILSSSSGSNSLGSGGDSDQLLPPKGPNSNAPQGLQKWINLYRNLGDFVTMKFNENLETTDSVQGLYKKRNGPKKEIDFESYALLPLRLARLAAKQAISQVVSL